MDNGSESLAHDGPSCPMSEQCVRMLDILDDMRDGFPPGWDDDAQLAEQLFEHLQTCPICTAAVARARAAREWQRQALRALLADGEQAVPSTTSRIMAAIAREREPVATTTAAVRPQEPLSPLPLQKRPVSRRPRSAFGGGRFLLAAVATVVIVAALSIFSYLTAFQPGPASRSRVTPTPTSPLFTRLPVSTDWSSVVAIGSVRSGDMQTVENYDPASGKHVPLLSGCCSRDTIVDGIAHNGGDLIYHRYDSTSQETTYYSLLGRSYVVQGRGTNAVWSTDDSSIFVGTSKQVIQITIKDATQKALKKPLHADLLAFYRSNFLYFIRSQPGNTYNLYRIDLSAGSPTLVVQNANSATFWLNPAGSTVYYTKMGDDGQRAVYAVASDGTLQGKTTALRTDATPIGYASDNALVIMQKVQNAFQVIKVVDENVPKLDRILIGDVAPGASSFCPTGADLLCDGNIALAPYGGSLVTLARYADGSQRLWSINLESGQRTPLPLSSEQTQMRLLGWSKFLIP
ncbi:MAG TPA: hypothetical protein VKX46_10835 [Ktedonobacteraceae bacterium]|nr:hypothetical protein [Ktedonobacteraceae bacterium]